MCLKIIFCDNSLRELLNFRGNVIRYYADHGFNVVLVAPETLTKYSLGANIRYIPVKLNRSGMNPLNDWNYFKTLCAIYKNERPDYVFHYTIKPNIYGTLAAHRNKISSSAMVAGLGYVFYKKSLGCWIARELYRFALRFADKVFVLNAANKDYLLAHQIVKSNQIIHLTGGEGVDLEHFSLQFKKNTSSKTVFLMIARLLYDKGYEEYVKAARILRRKGIEIECQVMGDLDLSYPNHVPAERLQQDQATGDISYLEFSPNVVERIGQADCIVLPSYNEGLSRVLMEAIAMGKAVITTDIPGCRETVDDGKNGYLVQPKDVNGLAEAMQKFASLNIEKRLEMGKFSRQKAEKQFDIRTVIQKYSTILLDNEREKQNKHAFQQKLSLQNHDSGV